MQTQDLMTYNTLKSRQMSKTKKLKLKGPDNTEQ